MAVPKVQYTPVVAPSGRRVHATSLAEPSRTACGRLFEGGWKVAMRHVTCRQCKLAMVFDCRPRRRRRRAR